MPHTKSARKNLRKSEKRRLHNRTVKKDIKLQLKEFLTAIESGTLEAAQEEFNTACKKLDKAAARRIVHPNLAARKKSQLAVALHKKKTTPAAPPKA
jgi:small subunit ribosomal protein S20